MTRATGLALGWFGLVLLGSTTAAQAQETAIRVVPQNPAPGRFIHLSVTPAPGTPLSHVGGNLADQPLSFERDSAGTWRALAGIPISAADSSRLTLVLGRGAGPALDTVVFIPLSRGDYPVERLRVAPRFSARPDSALAARVRDEVRRAGIVSTNAVSTPRLWSGPFARPRSTRVTSGYGGGREFNGQIQSRHLGVDLAGAEGELVLAPNRGIVALVDEFYYGGNVVYINHGSGVVTAYMHLSATMVAAGDTVSRGAPLGRVGRTGRVTGPHLHWVARFGRVTLDPLSLELLPLESFGEPER